MKTILVLVDFSEHSKSAARYAFAAAMHYKANLLFYNAYYIPNAVTADSGGIQPYYGDYEEFEKLSSGKLQELAQELRTTVSSSDLPDSPKIDCLNDLGRIGDNIESVLLQHDVWLAVMGEKRDIFLDNLLSGSDSMHILRHASCPVILVPEHVKFTPFKLITLASPALGPKEIAALNFASQLIADSDAQIRILQVLPHHPRQVQQAERLNTSIFNKNISFYTIKGELVEDSLIQYIQKEGSDLLALVHKDYDFFEGMFHRSLTKRIITNHLVPTLIFNS